MKSNLGLRRRNSKVKEVSEWKAESVAFLESSYRWRSSRILRKGSIFMYIMQSQPRYSPISDRTRKENRFAQMKKVPIEECCGVSVEENEDLRDEKQRNNEPHRQRQLTLFALLRFRRFGWLRAACWLTVNTRISLYIDYIFSPHFNTEDTQKPILSFVKINREVKKAYEVWSKRIERWTEYSLRIQ